MAFARDRVRDTEALELTIDGKRVHLATGPRSEAIRVPVTAGPHEVGVAFLRRPPDLIEQLREPFANPEAPGGSGGGAIAARERISTLAIGLMTAARTGRVEPLKLLLAHGVDVNARTPGGQTAVMWAAARNNADAVRILVEAGVDLTIPTHNPSPAARMSNFYSAPPTGFTALLFAVRAGSLDAVKVLLDQGADVNDELSGAERALLVATANAHWELAGVLLDRGAHPNAARAGWNALHQAVRSRRPNLFYSPGPIATGTVDSLDFIKKLIAKGVDVAARMMKNGMKDGQRNRVNRLGATAFFLAAKGTDFELMKVLVQAGADPKMPSADGTTPWMVAAGPGISYVGVVEFLVDQGARLDPRDVRGWTPFTIANGITHGDVFKQQPHTAALIEKLMAARGLSAAGQAADGTECLDCIQTRDDQAQATLDRDRRMEAEFAKTEAARLARHGAAVPLR